jgi:DNA polymerase elongation subunit (family B)
MKKIYQYTIDGKFVTSYNSIAAAASIYGVDESCIRKVASGVNSTCCNFIWKYEQTKVEPKVKILFLDIETAPSRAYVWGRWKQSIHQPQVISEWFILSWAAKWLNEDSVMSDRLRGEEVKKESDVRICTSLWTLLDECDIVVAHNGDAFDIPKIQSRLLMNNIAPPSPYRQIDTKNVAKKQFGFSSNKLDSLATYFKFGNKLDTDFELWKNCMEGDEESLRYMEKYNKEDVVILEKVYLKLRPWIKSHPNLDTYSNDETPTCPLCGSEHIYLETDKNFYTQSSKFDVYRCCDCGGVSRSKKAVKPLYPKQLSAIPK